MFPGSDPSTITCSCGYSYAAGTGLSQQTDTECMRSEGSYPAWIAETYKPSVFKDITCGGATTRSMWRHEGSSAPQVNAFTRDTDLVTITLGGNDLGFADVITRCVLAGRSPQARVVVVDTPTSTPTRAPAVPPCPWPRVTSPGSTGPRTG